MQTHPFQITIRSFRHGDIEYCRSRRDRTRRSSAGSASTLPGWSSKPRSPGGTSAPGKSKCETTCNSLIAIHSAMKRILSVIALAVISCAVAHAAETPTVKRTPKKRENDCEAVSPRLPADLKIVKDIVFKQVGDTKLDLMLFLPLEEKSGRDRRSSSISTAAGGAKATSSRCCDRTSSASCAA